MDSTGALELADVPERLLVIGGGIIGLEMATVYDALGSKVTVVEMLDPLIPGCDPDLVRPLQKRIEARYEAILLGTRVDGVEARENGLKVSFEGDDAPERGLRPHPGRRRPARQRRRRSAPRAAGVRSTSAASSRVDEQQRTNVPHIFAIGDIVGEPMLAHKATHEGKVAAEVIAGQNVTLRRARDPLGRLHRSRGRLDGPDRDRGQGRGHRLREGVVPLGGVRPRAVARPRRRA